MVQRTRVVEVAIDQFKPPMWNVRILINGIDAPRIERTRPPNNTVYLIALPEKQLCQIRSILPGNPGDQRFLHKSTPYISFETAKLWRDYQALSTGSVVWQWVDFIWHVSMFQ